MRSCSSTTVDDGQRELRVAVAGAVGDSERELGDPVEVAQPAAAGAAQDQVGDPVLLAADRVPRSASRQQSEQLGERALGLRREAEPRVNSAYLLVS